MQLYSTLSDSKYRLCFNELESNNIIKSLSGNISIKNIELCYFIENTLPKYFEECKHKRVMVLNIYNEKPYIYAVVLLQDIKMDFIKPKDKTYMFKITEVSFKDGLTFKKWLASKKYSYKIKDVKEDSVDVLIFNMTEQDEMTLFLEEAQIIRVCTLIEYICLLMASKLKMQISPYF